MSNNVLRILTALVGIPAIVILLYVGSWPFAVLVLAIALIAQYELYEMLDRGGLRAYRVPGMALGALLVLSPLFPPLLPAAAAVVVVVVAASPFLSARDEPGEVAVGTPVSGGDEASTSSPGRSTGRLPATLFGVVYPAGLLAFLVALRSPREGAIDDGAVFALVLAFFVVVWSTDTIAFYVGRAFGKRPLAPAISPKKTWAGAVGGTLGALVVAVVFKLIALDFLSWTNVVAFALVAAVFGQLGDLAESGIKRSVGVKDSGALLPGHGGMLDRFDAMILAAPAVYLYLAYAARLFGAGL